MHYRLTNLSIGLGVGLLLSLLLIQCKRDKPAAPTPQCHGADTMSIRYTNFVEGVMRQHCTGCHGGANPSKGLRLETYDQVKASSQSGEWYQSMASGHMPPSGKLDDCTLAKLKRWMDTGYPQ